MDNYIYFRPLDYLAKHGIVTRSDLNIVAGVNWVNSPIPFLFENGFIEHAQGDYKDVEYFQLTEKGRILYKKMDLFYETFKDMLAMLSKRKFKVKGFNKSVIV